MVPRRDRPRRQAHYSPGRVPKASGGGNRVLQPLTVITGILLGSAASIAIGLAVVLLIFLILSGEHPRLAEEFPSLLASTAIFIAMTALCAASFLSLVKELRWRWAAQAAMWMGLALVALYYLPGGP
jgi:hypothetical protein